MSACKHTIKHEVLKQTFYNISSNRLRAIGYLIMYVGPNKRERNEGECQARQPHKYKKSTQLKRLHFYSSQN